VKIQNPHELIGKIVKDTQGRNIGIIDKTWKSWNYESPGFFFGIRPHQDTRDIYFRGTHKLVPIYSDYIQNIENQVTLNKTMDQLSQFWNKVVTYGTKNCPTDELLERPIYDRNHSRVGTFTTWVETEGNYQQYGCFLDPYLYETWNFPQNTLMPIPTDYINDIDDTIILTKTIDELRAYWQQYFNQQQQF
jgi:sporulation protein YlmC with PRC-barrel domain